VFDVIGGQILHRSVTMVRSGGAVVSIAEPPRVPPGNTRAIFFVVEPDGMELAMLERRLRETRLQPLIGETYALEDALAAFDPARRSPGKPIIRVVDCGVERPRKLLAE
jgi:NADPH:quinone reductase-like Zn-dependent oxidoreductase